MKWTNEQKEAIESNGNNILVAAAAGSGKTAVLVERILNKVLNQGINVDEFLVVTFTNAAASEMKERLTTRFYQELEMDSSKESLIRKQILLLNKANITTIHSFCLEVIRNNYFETDLNPNFKISDEVENYLLELEALENIFERKYEEKDQKFEKLLYTYSNYKSDSGLRELVLKCYNFIQSSPFPIEWLEEKIELLKIEEIEFANTIWGKVLLKIIKDDVNDLYEQALSIKLELIADNNQNYLETIMDDIRQIENIKNKIDISWDETIDGINECSLGRIKTAKEGSEFLKEKTKAFRADARDRIKKMKLSFAMINSQKNQEDLLYMYDILKALKDLIKDFTIEFKNKKKEKNVIDFNDIEHYALNILVSKNDDGKYVPTNIAAKYRNKFKEILIDEYQDSNYIQEYILSQISNGKNMFMVGDVKQSIYRFRQARPDIFLKKYSLYSEKDNGNEYGKKIKLFKNFRSRKNILDFTNDIFKEIMSEDLGELNYTEDEFLNYAASYQNEDLPIEVNVLLDENEDNASNENDEILEEEPLDNIKAEAIFTANKIDEILKSKTKVFDKKISDYREVKESDIAILFRSTKNYSQIFLSELFKKGINAYSETEESFLNSIEVNLVMSILKIIDNPMQDIPLIAVLRSGIIEKITDSELIEIRSISSKTSFFEALMKRNTSEDDDLSKKINSFLKYLNNLQIDASYLKTNELVWKIISETGYYAYVSLMPDGEKRTKNLKLLFEKATSFEKTNLKGLFSFIKYIEKVSISSKDKTSVKLIGENDNVVRLMSIHKSKGLEFPVVLVCGVGKRFNMDDLKQNILMHSEIGIGPEYINDELGIAYKTLPKFAIKEIERKELLSEEMRLLYVALTRAKEKLIVIGTEKKTKESLNSKKIKIKNSNTFLKWLKIACNNSIKYYSKNDIEIIKSNNDIFINIPECKKSEININEAFCKDYNMFEQTMPTKISASQTEKLKQENVLPIEKPEFLKSTIQNTGAEKGTIIHKILELLPLKRYDNLEELKGKIKKITNENIGDLTSIYNFTRTNLYERILISKKVEKEKAFCILMSSNELFNQNDINENVIVQGIIDCYFEEADKIILLDYKSDFCKCENDLINKYKKQLMIYKKALEKATNKEVKEVFLYSLYLNKEIKIF